MGKDSKINTSKRPYEKPRLRVVNIASGIQTLGIGCKLMGSNTANYMILTSCGIANGCAQNGS